MKYSEDNTGEVRDSQNTRYTSKQTLRQYVYSHRGSNLGASSTVSGQGLPKYPLNVVRPSSYCTYHTVEHKQIFTIYPLSKFIFFADFRTNDDILFLYNSNRVVFCNRTGECLPRSTNCAFKYNKLCFFRKGLM